MTELFVDIEEMIASGYESVTVEAATQRNDLIRALLTSPLGAHLRSTSGQDGKPASGGWLLGAAAIKDDIEEYAPGAVLFPFGYLPVWSSGGGNLVVYGLKEDAFFWAAHDSWDPASGSITIPGTYEEIEFSPTNISRALILISSDPPDRFISDLLSGCYEAVLEELD